MGVVRAVRSSHSGWEALPLEIQGAEVGTHFVLGTVSFDSNSFCEATREKHEPGSHAETLCAACPVPCLGRYLLRFGEQMNVRDLLNCLGNVEVLFIPKLHNVTCLICSFQGHKRKHHIYSC